MTAPVSFPCGTFTAREVSREEVGEMQRLFEENPAYFERVHGEPPGPREAQEAFDMLPPAGWAMERKWLFAFRGRDQSIAGVADVIEGLFERGVWHIGFFMAADRLHGTGVPHALYAHLEAWIRGRGARWLRLGVVRGNARAERFWEKMGYVDVAERRDYVLGRKAHVLRVMAKPLAGGTLEEYRALVPRDAAALAAGQMP